MDRLMLPFLLKLCYVCAVLAGMVQSAYQFGQMRTTSGQTGNLVACGRLISGSIFYQLTADADGRRLVDASAIISYVFFFTGGNFIGGVWTNHDARKTLKTAGDALILVGAILLIAASPCLKEQTFLGLKKEMQQLGCFAMGIQNGILVATTGYANTVTTSGNITDIGLLLGGATTEAGRNLEKRRKAITLSVLTACFIGGSFLGGVLFYSSRTILGHRLGVAMLLCVCGLGFAACGLAAKIYSHISLAREEANALSHHAFSRQASPRPSITVHPQTDQQNNHASKVASISAAPQIPKATAPQMVQPLVIASYIASFCAGMIDVGSVEMLPDSPTPTHITGPSAKLGIGAAAVLMDDGSDKEKAFFIMHSKLCFVFTWLLISWCHDKQAAVEDSWNRVKRSHPGRHTARRGCGRELPLT
jgi:uncharacterized membrane protein YoaK (UPF0700 family)